MLLGGTWHGKIIAFNGQQRISAPRQIEAPLITNYDQLSQYATQKTQPINEVIDEYKVEVFRIGAVKKEFAVYVDLSLGSGELENMVAENWNKVY